MGRPVVERAFPGGRGLDSKPEEPDHGEAGVLDFSKLEGGLLLRVGRQAERVEVAATRVQPPFRVELGVPLELDVADDQDLDPDQRGDGKWKWLAQVG